MTLTRSRRLANLAIAIDSAASSAVLKKVTDSGEYVVPSFTDVTGAPTTLDSSLTSQIIDSSYVRLRQTGGVGNALDSAHLVAFADSNYITSRFTTGNSGFKLFRYDATANQTTFQDSDKKGNILTYNPQGIIVFYNGVALLDSAEYTATDGTSIVLDSAASLNAKIQIASWNIPSSGSGGSSGIGWGGDRAIQYTSSIEYYDIATTGNAASFGDCSLERYGAACSNATYALNVGGYTTATSNTIEYVTVSTTGDATDFGDLTVARQNQAACGDGTIGLCLGGHNQSDKNTVDQFTIATTGNATDFGDLSATSAWLSACNDATYALRLGGTTNKNTIEYFTFSTAGNATDFGDLLDNYSERGAGFQDSEGRGGMASGEYANQNVIQYVTVATPSNATDFGDLTTSRNRLGSSCNATRATFAGGNGINNIDYITVQTTGNASDFGDLTATYFGNCGTSGAAS